MKKTLKITSLFLGLFILFSVTASANSNQIYSWYCKRNKEHKQPRLDANMRFIENYDAYYVDRSHPEGADDRVVYLTFDAGYENGNIERILDVMKAENVKGAFFILENLVEKNPELVCRMVDDGHTVANHTSHHKDMTKVDRMDEFAAELDALNTCYKKATGRELSKYYRPPEGRFDERSLSFAKELGYKTVFWSFAYADWDNQNQPSATAAKAKILENIHNGAVILLHPTSSTNADILSDVIKALKADGYRFGTLDELTEK